MPLLCQTGIFAGGVNADEEKILAGVLVILCIVAAVFGYYLYRMWPMLSTTMGSVELTEEHQPMRWMRTALTVFRWKAAPA